MSDHDRDHEVGAEHQEVLKLTDVKGEARRNEKKIPENRAECGEKQRRPTAQTRSCQNNCEQVKERNRPIAGEIEDRQ